MKQKLPVHLLLRFSDSLLKAGSTIDEHNMVVASKTLPKGDESLVPDYYAKLDISRYVNFWVKIEEIFPTDQLGLNKMKVASSVLPLRETHIKSSTGHFIIQENKLLY